MRASTIDINLGHSPFLDLYISDKDDLVVDHDEEVPVLVG